MLRKFRHVCTRKHDTMIGGLEAVRVDTTYSTGHTVTISNCNTLHYSMSVHWHILTYSRYDLVNDKFFGTMPNTLVNNLVKALRGPLLHTIFKFNSLAPKLTITI